MQVHQGPGWRFAVDPSRDPYPVLVGTDDWAVELTAAEASALRGSALRLVSELETLSDQLMPEEQISLELDCDLVWVELEGRPGELSLRFVLQPLASTGGGRGVEGRWTVPATAALLAVLAQHHLEDPSGARA